MQFPEVIFEHLHVLRPECLPCHAAQKKCMSLLSWFAYVFLLDEHHSEALEQDFQLFSSLQ